MISCWDAFVLLQLDDVSKLLASVYYTRWESIQTIDLKNVVTTAGVRDVEFEQNYSNTFRFAVGGDYKYSDTYVKFKVRELMKNAGINGKKNGFDYKGIGRWKAKRYFKVKVFTV